MPHSIAALGITHSPLKGAVDPAPEVVREHDLALAEAAAWVRDFDPELVVVFGPDHYRGFFYDLMPSWCIGIAAVGLGDWYSPRGPVKVPADIAGACVAHLQAAGFDPAFSHHMKVDHGITQPLGWLDIGLDQRPVLPIFINCVATPMPSYARVRAFGAAVGQFVASLDQRVLVIGSGGLSHDPPVPQLSTAAPETRQRIVHRRDISAEDERAMRERVVGATRDFLAGNSRMLPPNEAWDHAFLSSLGHGRLHQTDSLGEGLEKVAGCGGHETRTWVAAFAALERAAGPYALDTLYYRCVPEWLTGMGIVRGIPESMTG